MKKKFITFIRGVKNRAIALLVFMVFTCINFMTYAQSSGEGKAAIKQVANEIKSYITDVQSLLYAIAAVVGLGGVATIFIKMNNEENDIKKTIMLVMGSCIVLIALAEAIPAMFGA